MVLSLLDRLMLLNRVMLSARLLRRFVRVPYCWLCRCWREQCASNTSRAKPKRKTRGAQARKKKVANNISRLRIVITMVVTVCFAIGLYSLNKVSLKSQSADPTPSSASNNDRTINSSAQKNSGATTDDFTFYSMLKDFKVVIPEDTGYNSERANEKNYIYLIQAGSFKTHRQAEQRLVELKLLGLEPTIHDSKNADGKRWHRVQLGPFTSSSDVASVRATILSNGIEAMVMKRKS